MAGSAGGPGWGRKGVLRGGMVAQVAICCSPLEIHHDLVLS